MNPTQIKILDIRLNIEEDECSCVVDVDISNFKNFMRLGRGLSNKIHEGGKHTLYFCADEDPIEILYHHQENDYDFELPNCEIKTKKLFDVFHLSFDESIRKFETLEEATKFAEQYPVLDIFEITEYVSGTYNK